MNGEIFYLDARNVICAAPKDEFIAALELLQLADRNEEQLHELETSLAVSQRCELRRLFIDARFVPAPFGAKRISSGACTETASPAS